jgi:hypothetical protein
LERALPETKSFALIIHDPDVPGAGEHFPEIGKSCELPQRICTHVSYFFKLIANFMLVRWDVGTQTSLVTSPVDSAGNPNPEAQPNPDPPILSELFTKKKGVLA